MEVKKIYYSIQEISELLNIPTSTLYFWIKMFPQLKPAKYKRYSSADVEIMKRIQFLLREKKMSIEYARNYLENYRKHPPRRRIACKSNNDIMRLLAEIKGRTEDAHIIVMIEAIERYLTKEC